MPLIEVHQTVHDGQPHSRAHARLAGGEERLENAIVNVLRDTAAFVADRNAHKLAGKLGMARSTDPDRIDAYAVRRNAYLARPIDCIAGVLAEIDQDAMQMCRIDVEIRQSLVDTHRQGHASREGRSEQSGQRACLVGNGYHRNMERAAAREDQQLLHQRPGAFAGGFDLLEIRGHALRTPGSAYHRPAQPGKPEDGDQDIVEVMRNAGSHRSQNLHACRPGEAVPEFVLQALGLDAIGHILVDADHRQWRTIDGEKRLRQRTEHADLPITSANPEIHPELMALTNRRLQCRFRGRQILGQDVLGPVLVGGYGSDGRVDAVQRVGRCIPAQTPADQIIFPHPQTGRVGRQPQTLASRPLLGMALCAQGIETPLPVLQRRQGKHRRQQRGQKQPEMPGRHAAPVDMDHGARPGDADQQGRIDAGSRQRAYRRQQFFPVRIVHTVYTAQQRGRLPALDVTRKERRRARDLPFLAIGPGRYPLEALAARLHRHPYIWRVTHRRHQGTEILRKQTPYHQVSEPLCRGLQAIFFFLLDIPILLQQRPGVRATEQQQGDGQQQPLKAVSPRPICSHQAVPCRQARQTAGSTRGVRRV
ncbi:MAG: hypothetical protein AW09_003038 [Candidatus Accumulibacter phosphatis]|uniref:Uncharacterized protein n=1 Tax=Candidatus Accumulibacter phosphatis TaxID=327160 RepID=A0A080M3V4_9PROT|nr:MAG: hypothetical protein AW09_003038 [Candidatus Accumulibacter phosphatis]